MREGGRAENEVEGGGAGGAEPHSSVRRRDKDTRLVYMRRWENKLKIPAGTPMHIKTGLFEK